jgi:hypothetical protein
MKLSPNVTWGGVQPLMRDSIILDASYSWTSSPYSNYRWGKTQRMVFTEESLGSFNDKNAQINKYDRGLTPMVTPPVAEEEATLTG